MKQCDNESLSLNNYVRKLHLQSGQFKLYIWACQNEKNYNIERLKLEIEKIKHLIAIIENEINSI